MWDHSYSKTRWLWRFVVEIPAHIKINPTVVTPKNKRHHCLLDVCCLSKNFFFLKIATVVSFSSLTWWGEKNASFSSSQPKKNLFSPKREVEKDKRGESTKQTTFFTDQISQWCSGRFCWCRQIYMKRPRNDLYQINKNWYRNAKMKLISLSLCGESLCLASIISGFTPVRKRNASCFVFDFWYKKVWLF